MTIDRNKLFRKLEDILALDEKSISNETVLQTLDVWDSVAVLSTITLVDSDCGVILDGTEVANCQTAGDLCNLIESRVM